VACHELHDDLRSIGAALRADSRGTVTAPRDFRLSVEAARRLGGTVSPRGFLAAFRRSIVLAARPLGASLTVLGLVGLLVSTGPLGGATTSAPGAEDMTVTQGTDSEGAQQPGPTPSDTRLVFGPAMRTSVPAVEDGSQRKLAGQPAPATLLLGGSLALIVAGLGLLSLALRRSRQSARRAQDSL
jgi:hypothetical protein